MPRRGASQNAGPVRRLALICPRTDNRGVIKLAVALSFALSGCQYLQTGPAIDCGQVPTAECEKMVNALLQQAREEFPDKQVKSVRLSTPTGGYDVQFTDGTGFAVVGH